MNTMIRIANRIISAGYKPYIIAELSGNHNGDIRRAKRLIDAAKSAGADAVKLQTYRPDTITIQSDRPEFRIKSGLWRGRSLYDLYNEAHTPWEWHAELFAYAKTTGITIFSTPFDETAVDLLESLDAPAYKIASAEIIDWELIESVAKTGKPVLISSGMASDEEIDEALHILRTNGTSDIVLLHCVSAYPTPLSESCLSRIEYLYKKFGVLIGLSDHTLGNAAAVAAVTLGAVVVEKHFTLSRDDGGIDAAFSIEKDELERLCRVLVDIHSSLHSSPLKRPSSESENSSFRRSLYFVRSLKTGQVITREDVKSIRPGLGLKPRYLNEIIGKKAATDIPAGTPTSWSLIES